MIVLVASIAVIVVLKIKTMVVGVVIVLLAKRAITVAIWKLNKTAWSCPKLTLKVGFIFRRKRAEILDL